MWRLEVCVWVNRESTSGSSLAPRPWGLGAERVRMGGGGVHLAGWASSSLQARVGESQGQRLGVPNVISYSAVKHTADSWMVCALALGALGDPRLPGFIAPSQPAPRLGTGPGQGRGSSQVHPAAWGACPGWAGAGAPWGARPRGSPPRERVRGPGPAGAFQRGWRSAAAAAADVEERSAEPGARRPLLFI